MKNFSHNDAFGWVFFILTLATFNVGVYERASLTDGAYAALGRVGSVSNRSTQESSAQHIIRHESAIVSESLGGTLVYVRSAGRRVVATTFGRTVRSTNSNSVGGGSKSFQTASNRLVFERDGLNAFLFRSSWSSLTETRSLYLLLLTLRN